MGDNLSPYSNLRTLRSKKRNNPLYLTSKKRRCEHLDIHRKRMENKLILYKDDNGNVSVNVRFADEDVWLTQANWQKYIAPRKRTFRCTLRAYIRMVNWMQIELIRNSY